MIGRIGSILGENNINIASLRVGRRKIDGDAAMGITMDRPITPDIKDQLNSEEGIVDVIFLSWFNRVEGSKAQLDPAVHHLSIIPVAVNDYWNAHWL